MLNLSLTEILIVVPTILIALTVHELSHAGVALALGDDTAKQQGRITANPLKHIDPIGFIMIVVVGFGWAKPVRFSVENLKKPIRDEILIAFAGPVSNLLLGFLGTVVLRFGYSLIPVDDVATYDLFIEIVTTFIAINIGLAVFNAIPIPPLDGSHLFTGFISKKSAHAAQLFLKYGFLVLVAIIIVERVMDYDILRIGRATNYLFNVMLRIVGL